MSHGHPEGGNECADFIESIVYLLDNELDDSDVERVKAHLDECAPCLGRYDVQRTIKSVVARSCLETAPDSLRQRVMMSLTEVTFRSTD